ncbi:MAG: hypothetical protein V3V96_05935, partial [Acidiferrobacterales bacterium]
NGSDGKPYAQARLWEPDWTPITCHWQHLTTASVQGQEISFLGGRLDYAALISTGSTGNASFWPVAVIRRIEYLEPIAQFPMSALA